MKNFICFVLLSALPTFGIDAFADEVRPNILFCLSDDQSWPHASAYGEPVMLEHREQNAFLFDLAFGKRPREEFYDCRKDPDQLNNLTADLTYQKTLAELSARLTTHLKSTEDARETGAGVFWDEWKYYGRSSWKLQGD